MNPAINTKANVDLSAFGSINPMATCTVLTGNPVERNTFEHPGNAVRKRQL